MPLRYLFDENLRGVPWHAVQRYNQTSPYPIDVICVGDELAPPHSTPDPDLLRWAEQEQRIIVTLDVSTMPTHLQRHLASGREAPGLFIVMGWVALPAVIEFLAVAAYASEPDEWRNRIHVISK